MKEKRARKVRDAFRDQYANGRDASLLASHLAAARSARGGPEAEFRTPEFQRRLWEIEGPARVNSGRPVVVAGAYDDPEIVDALWSVRVWQAPDDSLARARGLDAAFASILKLVTPRHNSKRPTASLGRIFAALRPEDTLYLIDAYRTRFFRQWFDLPKHRLDFIGQHVLLRQALREILGPETSLEDHILYSQFAWFVWVNC